MTGHPADYRGRHTARLRPDGFGQAYVVREQMVVGGLKALYCGQVGVVEDTKGQAKER
jgi:hypothetical protein